MTNGQFPTVVKTIPSSKVDYVFSTSSFLKQFSFVLFKGTKSVRQGVFVLNLIKLKEISNLKN